MRGFLLNEKQPFGLHRDERTMGPGLNGIPTSNPTGGLTMRANNGSDHGPSFADKNPGAHAYACRGIDHPLTHWTGKPKGEA
jgi:hypothetical protein